MLPVNIFCVKVSDSTFYEKCNVKSAQTVKTQYRKLWRETLSCIQLEHDVDTSETSVTSIFHSKHFHPEPDLLYWLYRAESEEDRKREKCQKQLWFLVSFEISLSYDTRGLCGSHGLQNTPQHSIVKVVQMKWNENEYLLLLGKWGRFWMVLTTVSRLRLGFKDEVRYLVVTVKVKRRGSGINNISECHRKDRSAHICVRDWKAQHTWWMCDMVTVVTRCPAPGFVWP